MIFLNNKKCYVILTHRRFIPVHTGNSIIFWQASLIRPVYPCAYRELHCRFNTINAVGGLSLCIQGTLAKIGPVTGLPRFIPVHTGNSSLFVNFIKSESVYPCAYRELRYYNNGAHMGYGLSLCIQGTHH